jgi:hypothetical protein
VAAVLCTCCLIDSCCSSCAVLCFETTTWYVGWCIFGTGALPVSTAP